MSMESWSIIFGAIPIVLAILGVYVRTETRTAVHEKRLNDMDARLTTGDGRMERLKDSIDKLQLSIERLATLEEMRAKIK